MARTACESMQPRYESIILQAEAHYFKHCGLLIVPRGLKGSNQVQIVRDLRTLSTSVCKKWRDEISTSLSLYASSPAAPQSYVNICRCSSVTDRMPYDTAETQSPTGVIFQQQDVGFTLHPSNWCIFSNTVCSSRLWAALADGPKRYSLGLLEAVQSCCYKIKHCTCCWGNECAFQNGFSSLVVPSVWDRDEGIGFLP